MHYKKSLSLPLSPVRNLDESENERLVTQFCVDYIVI